MDKESLYIRSKTYGLSDKPYRRFSVTVYYSQADWQEFEFEAKALKMEPESFLKQRLKRAVRPDVGVSRIVSERDRFRVHDDYTDFWMPFVRYLIVAQVSVLISGVLLDWILGFGKSYLVFHWVVLGCLLTALTSWIGLKVSFVNSRGNRLFDNEILIQLELRLGKLAEKLMWLSFGFFLLAVSFRVVLAILDWLPQIIG